MRRQIQVHFENGGQLVWSENVPEEDAPNWLATLSEREIDKLIQPSEAEMIFCQDKETERKFFFNLTKVTAIIMIKEPEQDDIIARTYAPKDRQEQENNQLQYQGDGEKWPPAETGGGRCFK